MRKLSAATGLDLSTLVRWKSGARVPTLDSVQPVFDFLQCGLADAPTLLSERNHAQRLNRASDRMDELEARVRELESCRNRWEGHLEALEAQRDGRR